MGKFLFWIVIAFVVLLGLRLLNLGAAKRRARDASADGKGPPPSEAMVRCRRCGVYLPRAEALPAGDGFTCGEPACTARG
jgi:hypothetical protein